MDISHWEAAIHYGVPLAQYCDQTRSFNAISRRSPPVYSLAQRLRNPITCVDSWVHKVPENGHQPLGRGNSLWHSACPILCSNPILQRYFTEIAPFVLPCIRLRNTKVPVLTHESIGYPKMDISHWDATIHYGIQLAQYCNQTRSFNATLQRSPPV